MVIRQLISIACIVYLRLTFYVEPQEQIPYQAVTSDGINYDNKLQKNLQDLFGSVSVKNMRKNEIYRRMLKREVKKEQKVFDMLKEELRVARSAHTKKKTNENAALITRRQTSENNHSPNKADKQSQKDFAVTSLVGAENLYRKLGPSVGYIRSSPYDELCETRREVCAAILRSPLFADGYNVIHVDARAESNRTRATINHPSTADCDTEYKLCNISIDESQQLELVFLCLAEDQHQKVVEYFISREYDLSHDAVDENVMMWQPDVARFVFSSTAENTMPKLIAIAEGATSSYHFYSDVEKEEKPLSAIDHVQSRLCRISPTDGKRLCTIMFTSGNLRSTVRYCPYKDNIEPKCVKTNITYIREFINFTHTGFIEDWSMLECKARKVQPDSTGAFESYYIAYDDLSMSTYKFLIFRRLSDKIVSLFGYFKTHLLEYNQVNSDMARSRSG